MKRWTTAHTGSLCHHCPEQTIYNRYEISKIPTCWQWKSRIPRIFNTGMQDLIKNIYIHINTSRQWRGMDKIMMMIFTNVIYFFKQQCPLYPFPCSHHKHFPRHAIQWNLFWHRMPNTDTATAHLKRVLKNVWRSFWHWNSICFQIWATVMCSHNFILFLCLVGERGFGESYKVSDSLTSEMGYYSMY